MKNNNFLKGSEWRKWDLQVQPGEKDWYLNFNPNDSRIVNRIEAFLQNAISKGIEVIAITDHNFGGSIDVAMQIKNRYNIIILPGLEVNANEGWHLLIFFNPEWKEKNKYNSWADTIRNFLSKCGIDNPYDNNGNVPLGITTEQLIKDIHDENAGILFFAHSISDKGFFKRGNNDSRRKIIKMHIEENYLFGFDIKTSKNKKEKEEVEKEIQNCINNGSYKLSLPVILSSDSHDASSVGTLFTWIKADPTFEGLKQILFEPEERVFIGDEPELSKRVKENKTKFINTIKINQVEGYSEDKGIWFKNVEIPLNPGLVAIIGNKGSGKSALTDIISLCGNSYNYEDFSFLNNNRFLQSGLSENFKAELIWESQESIKKGLNEPIDKNSPERVKYIPQSFFEKLTNSLETGDFEKTLEDVVFSYIPEAERLDKNSFSDLIKYKKQLYEYDFRTKQKEIEKINIKIIELEKKIHPDYKKQIEEKLKLKKIELEEHKKNKPQEVSDPSKDKKITKEQEDKQKELSSLNKQLEELQGKITQAQNDLKDIKSSLEELKQIKKQLENFKNTLDKYIKDNKEKFLKYDLQINEVIKFEINDNYIDQKIKECQNKQNELSLKLLTEDDLHNSDEDKKDFATQQSLILQKNKLANEIKKIEEQFSEPERKYQKYLKELTNWDKRKKEIEGNEDKLDTIKWYEKEIEYLKEQLKIELHDLRDKRLSLSVGLFEKKQEILSIYEEFKKVVNKEIEKFQNILGAYSVSIDTSLRFNPNFANEFLKYVNQKMKGTFCGIDEGKNFLDKLIKKHDVNSEDGIKQFLSDIIDYLEKDKRENLNDEQRNIKDQILKEEKWLEFYNFIFSLNYIELSYELKLGNKNLIQLSPGERGALLIVFYLLLEKENIPLIIDQPEENLDNESVYKIITHFIKKAKTRRQVIIVTHNPNIAIVGDADQIIYVKIDKTNKNKFTFESGSIENPEINKHCSDILEGTFRAFNTRRLKYFKING